MAAPTPLPLPLAGMCAKDYVHIFAMVSTFFLITYIRSVSYHVNTVNALTFGLASLFALSPRSYARQPRRLCKIHTLSCCEAFVTDTLVSRIPQA